MNILIIGGGNMGTTYAKSFLRSHLAKEEKVMILEKSSQKAAFLSEEKIGRVFKSPNDCFPFADLVIFAVKPQDAHEMFLQVKDMIDPQQVFLSIMAGVKINTIQESLGAQKVIRAMPNLPAQIGLGMTVFTATQDVTRIELVMVQNVLSTTGKTVYVEEESMIDAATAISGSGPAYVFFFMDAMIKAAQNMGFSEPQAELLVRQTFQGAVELYDQSEQTCEEWIRKVSSKGGTTEAAMAFYKNCELNQHIMQGAEAALKRAVELGALEG